MCRVWVAGWGVREGGEEVSQRAAKQIKTLADLTPDSMNPNKGTERGAAVLDWSLTNLGAGRSILADRNGNVIAGNKTLDAAAEHDFPIRVVATDGKELVVVQRTDLDLFGADDAERNRARQLSIVDNEATLVGYARDAEVLLTHQASGVDLGPIIPPHEVDALRASLIPPNVEFKEYDESVENEVKYHECPSCGHRWPQ